MRFRLIYLVLTLLIACNGFAQSPKIDSLRGLLRHELRDTTRIDVLLDLAQQTRFTNADQSTGYSNEALVHATRIEDADRLTGSDVDEFQSHDARDPVLPLLRAGSHRHRHLE